VNADISIALATFNGDRYLQEQLESLAKQTVLPKELIVSDDSSSDRTGEIIASFIHNAPFPVRFHINSCRLGYSANFFQAAHLCTGSYIAFCDQDDIWEIDKIECITRLLWAAHRKLDIILHTCKLLYESPTKSLDLYPPHLLHTRVYYPFGLDPFAIVPGHCIIATKELIEVGSSLSSLLQSNSIVRSGHDDIVYFLGACAGITQVISIPLVSWRQHLGNTSGVPIHRLTTNNELPTSSHIELMGDLSDRWKRLSCTLVELSNNVNASYSSNLKASAALYFARGCYYDSRKVISDFRQPFFVRMTKYLNAHLRYSYASGLRLSCVRAIARDACTLLLPSRCMHFLAKTKMLMK
jgi:glycosyltransferase involved in cell wall biosynthesis